MPAGRTETGGRPTSSIGGGNSDDNDQTFSMSCPMVDVCPLERALCRSRFEAGRGGCLSLSSKECSARPPADGSPPQPVPPAPKRTLLTSPEGHFHQLCFQGESSVSSGAEGRVVHPRRRNYNNGILFLASGIESRNSYDFNLRMSESESKSHRGVARASFRGGKGKGYFNSLLIASILSVLLALASPASAQSIQPTTLTLPDETPFPSAELIPTVEPTTKASNMPTSTTMPSTMPSLSTAPSVGPTTSEMPSALPSAAPTITPVPTVAPSSFPSSVPSLLPSSSPTAEPTFVEPIESKSSFRQRFRIGNGRIFTTEEIELFEALFTSYTLNFTDAEVQERTNTSCSLDFQVGLGRRRLGQVSLTNSDRELQSFQANEVDYTMTYRSIYVNVTGYTIDFQSFMNSNLEAVAEDMQLLGLNVTSAGEASIIFIGPDPTPAPTTSPGPTNTPSGVPTQSPFPSQGPTDVPSESPTEQTAIPTGTLEPASPSPTESTTSPTEFDVSSSVPSVAPTQEEEEPVRDNTVIVVSIVVAGTAVLLLLLVYYRRRKKNRENEFQRNAANGKRKDGKQSSVAEDGAFVEQVVLKNAADVESRVGSAQGYRENMHAAPGPGGMLSPSESLVSNPSLLSPGISFDGESGDEEDGTSGIADEFDQYKDPNLEQFRKNIEGNLTGFDGMISQALTKALIDDDIHYGESDLLWGSSEARTGAEIEASALGEVSDWLKRKDHATNDERYVQTNHEFVCHINTYHIIRSNTLIFLQLFRRVFMQEMLNKMVASVRHGVLDPDDASRSIHECAALLDLPLATEIPVSTLVITGMRKTVEAKNLIEAFSEFGEVSEAAVSSKERGFGKLIL